MQNRAFRYGFVITMNRTLSLLVALASSMTMLLNIAVTATLNDRGVNTLLGSFVGLFTLLVGKRVWSAKLPFGPYLAFGAVSWLFFGDQFLRWYLSLLNP